MSLGPEDVTMLITVTAQAMISTGKVQLSLSAREGQAPGTWRYSLHDSADPRAAVTGRVANALDHMAALVYAAGVTAAGYERGTPERELLEFFAADFYTSDAPGPIPQQISDCLNRVSPDHRCRLCR